MLEIELKLQVPEAARAAVEAAVAGRSPLPRLRLQAAYLDTPDRRLASSGLALRLRREGRQWVQTLKGSLADGISRHEHNVARGAAAAMPAIEPQLHSGTAVGKCLLAVLADEPDAPLVVRLRTDIRRRTRVLVVRATGQPQARVELAFDLGSIAADGDPIAVCELEIELLTGVPDAVIATARRWVAQHGLWLDARSKAERGDLLSLGERIAPPTRSGRAPTLGAAMSAAVAWCVVLRHCAAQVIGNASQIASGEHLDAHVHQLRVGLRRLRSAVALFEGVADAALGEAAAQLFRRLGALRDQAAIDAAFAADLRAAQLQAGLLDEPLTPPRQNLESAAEVLRDGPSQALLFDLVAAMQCDGGEVEFDAEHSLQKGLAARLNRWHRELLADAARHDQLDDESRHRLRKRAKRLRYSAEFAAPLFEPRAVRRYLKRLRALQERLGSISDVVTAMHAFAPRAAAEPRAMFALGWFTAQREVLIARAAPELAAFAAVDRFWKKRG
jgi:triphosphatase